MLAAGPAWGGLVDVLHDVPPAAPATAPAVVGAPAVGDPASPAVPARAASTGEPVRVRAASVGLDAPVVGVGVTDDGLMEVPERVAEVGWYRFGPRPGAPDGSAVLAGHVDDRVQGEGAFADLSRMRPGDEVAVDGSAGPVVLRVTEVRTYTKDTLPLADLFRETGPPRLVLVTCDGPFDTDARSYRDNLVVYAEPV
ncbi:class F sortase [Actinomycetospora cinnamomea]|uniref:Sortase (Surface protein transpeptidase) n=1 Tax=Actinomycetospora cinnamomea TaxID=663609 RepID=A0A2U1F448_9PSEU|nr:class F sortase [Actinomycetospora cinnamomea]PVZ06938.1 sortase (surface protein transpeptidase) [Actinomycetospora cinnamomea]